MFLSTLASRAATLNILHLRLRLRLRLHTRSNSRYRYNGWGDGDPTIRSDRNGEREETDDSKLPSYL